MSGKVRLNHAVCAQVSAETSKWEKNEDDAEKEDKGAANKKKKAKPAPKKKKGMSSWEHFKAGPLKIALNSLLSSQSCRGNAASGCFGRELREEL